MESIKIRGMKLSRDAENATEQQISAERRRQAMIFKTQDEHCSAAERAESDKQSNIIRAQSGKQSQVLEVQDDVISTVLRAHAAESMDERVIIDKSMKTLVNIGVSPSTTYTLPQELAPLLGHYGKGLFDSDVQQAARLGSKAFDEETREPLGLGGISEILGELDGVGTIDISTDTIDIEIEGGGVE